MTEREEAATGLAEAVEAIVSETETSPVEAGTGMPLEAVPGDTADRMLALAVTAAHRAWAEAGAEADVAAVAAGGVGKRFSSR